MAKVRRGSAWRATSTKSEEYKDIIQPMLEEKLHLGQGMLAERQMLADMLKSIPLWF